VKQGYALKRCVETVLRVTGAKKVILVGHSMGGLCAREYLQRRVNGVPKWWIEPNSADGHKVAKLVTIGTPHLGSNTFNFRADAQDNIASLVPSLSSEASRDLRYSYNSGTAGLYLFGGDESDVNTSLILNGYHNADVNCNGVVGDIITGIHEGLTTSLPIPRNIRYTWITSLFTLTGDGVVDIDRQWLFTSTRNAYPVGLTDTLMTNKFHTSEAGDYLSLLRGLDEPGADMIDMAYELTLNKQYRGAITHTTGFNPLDTDVYVCKIPPSVVRRGKYIVRLQDLVPRTQGRRYLEFILVDTSYYIIRDTVSDSWNTETLLTLDSSEVAKTGGIVYIAVIGTAKKSEWMLPYQISSRYEYAQVSDVDESADKAASLNATRNFQVASTYPSPSSEKSVIRLSGATVDQVHYSLYDQLGRCVTPWIRPLFNSGGDSLVVDVSVLQSGMYTFVARTDDGRHATGTIFVVR
jgi:hypothetical protein